MTTAAPGAHTGARCARRCPNLLPLPGRPCHPAETVPLDPVHSSCPPIVHIHVSTASLWPHCGSTCIAVRTPACPGHPPHPWSRCWRGRSASPTSIELSLLFTAIEGIGTVGRSDHKEHWRHDVAPDRCSDHTTCARVRSDSVRVPAAPCLLTSVHHISCAHAAPYGNA